MIEQPKKKSFIPQPDFIKKIILTGQLERFIVYLSAVIPSIILVIIAIFSLFGFFDPLIIKISKTSFISLGNWYDFIILAIIISTGIYGIYEFLRMRRIRKINERFPDFVRDLAESRRAGMTFTKAILYSSKGNYGMLTPEIQKIAQQISWGSSVNNALKDFSKRVKTRLITRTISLIIEASKTGGNVADVLDAASRDAREVSLIDSERRANMISYIAIIYIGLGVFLLIILILTKTLIPSLQGKGFSGLTSTISGGGAISSNRITVSDVTNLFFAASVVQSIFMGVIVGIFEERDIISGIKHIFIMVLITWIIFKFIIPL